MSALCPHGLCDGSGTFDDGPVTGHCRCLVERHAKEPNKAAIAFATGVYVEMFGEVSTDPADVNRMVVLAIAFDSCARAAHDAVAAEREACVVICDNARSVEQASRLIRARGAK